MVYVYIPFLYILNIIFSQYFITVKLRPNNNYYAF